MMIFFCKMLLFSFLEIKFQNGTHLKKIDIFDPTFKVFKYTAIFLQTSRYRHVSVTVWETRHIKTIRPVQNRGLT